MKKIKYHEDGSINIPKRTRITSVIFGLIVLIFVISAIVFNSIILIKSFIK